MFLRPMTLRAEYYDHIEGEIQSLFDRIIYAPLLRILGAKAPQELQNDKNLSATSAAIRAGNVWYTDGQFGGKFSSSISSELRGLGATWNPKSKTYSLPREQVPPQLQIAIANSTSTYKVIQMDVIDALSIAKVDDIIQKHSNTPRAYDETLKKMDSNWRTTLAPAAKAISIPANLSAAQREVIAREWGQNLDLYIKGWVDSNILELREKVQRHVFAGGRAGGLEKMIMDNYGVSRRKAKFLARQETSLLMSEFQETRYSASGITEYKWGGADDERERPDHRALNNKIFRFDQPPITNRKTGARNNPGQDYGCRCVAIPVVPKA